MMRQRGFSLAEVAMATGIGVALTSLAGFSGAYLMAQSKAEKVAAHAEAVFSAIEAYVAKGGETNQPWPLSASAAALETSVAPFLSNPSGGLVFTNPVSGAADYPLPMSTANVQWCNDGVIWLSAPTNIVNANYHGKILYCYLNDINLVPSAVTGFIQINDRGKVMKFQKYAVVAVDHKGYLARVLGR